MADIIVDVAAVAADTRGMRSVVFVSQDIGYSFVIGTGTDFFYVKTTNGGRTWGSEVSISGADTVFGFDVWYDQWTPGDTGRNIHIFWFGTAADAATYQRLNTNGDVLSSAVLILDGATAVASRGSFISGAKMRGGNLLCVFNLDNLTEAGTYKSTTNGATWTALTNATEADLDQCYVFPANVADPQDAWLLYHDVSTDELTIKTFDDSAGTYSESSALSLVENGTDAVGQYGFAGSIRHSDGALIFAYMSTYDAAGGATTNFNVYSYSGTTLTALTAIATGVDHIYYPGVYLNQDQPDWIYVAHLGVTAGTSTLTTSMPVHYSLSKDRGITWTKDIAYSTSTTDYRSCQVPLNGERFLVIWHDISALDSMTNYDNSKEFGFTNLNNYQFPRAVGQNNTGIISVNGGKG